TRASGLAPWTPRAIARSHVSRCRGPGRWSGRALRRLRRCAKLGANRGLRTSVRRMGRVSRRADRRTAPVARGGRIRRGWSETQTKTAEELSLAESNADLTSMKLPQDIRSIDSRAREHKRNLWAPKGSGRAGMPAALGG